MQNKPTSTDHHTTHQNQKAKPSIEAIAEALQCGDPACACNHQKENGWTTHCPCHEDETPSLSLSEGDDRKILVHCHAGCSQEEVISALRERGLWPTEARGKARIVATYDYIDEEGELLYQACRMEPKSFRQRKPDGKGGWTYKVKGTRLVPYRLPELLKADQVFIVEGEKDADNLAAYGLTATCNAMGAGKWRKEYNDVFKDKEVIILPDNDEPGRQHAQQVAHNLNGIAASVKVVGLPGLSDKGDVSDWLAAGHAARDLLEIAAAAPEWSPPAQAKKRTKTNKPGAKSDDQPDLTPVRELLPDAPVPKEVLIPEDYHLTQDGLYLKPSKAKGSNLVLLAPAPILIAGRQVSISDGTENVRLAWWRDQEWRQVIVERATIAGTSITDLANNGMPVTTINRNNLIKYLSVFEAQNLDCLPRTLISQQLGWQGDEGSLGFLWGNTLLPPVSSQGGTLDAVAFRGADLGDEQIAEAFCSRGSLADWIEVVHQVAEYPRVIIAVCASLTPPLLSILGCPNFVIDWCNPTSTGKTTVLRLGASCWGVPDERSPSSVLLTWDSTRVFINRASSLLQSLPLILDDTKRVKNTRDIPKTLYDVASGRDRGRGSVKGTRKSGFWRTVLLSSGEAPATSFTQDGGTRARVLTLWGPPFGRADDTTAPIVSRLNQAILENCGHAGPKFVEFLVSRRDDWPKWREKYNQVQQSYLNKAGSDPVMGRLCAYFAALDMAAGLAHAALELPWSYRDPVEALWNDLVSGAEEADMAARALITLMGWARGNQASFFGRNMDRPPFQGYAGRWDNSGSWEYIAFLPHRLNELLLSFGYEPEAIIRTWHDRGWLVTDKGKNRRQKRVRMDNDQRPWTIAVRRGVVEEMDGDL